MYRLKERIPIILKQFNNDDVKRKYIKELLPGLYSEGRQLDLFDNDIDNINKSIEKWNKNSKEIEKYWTENYQKRLVHVLIDLDIIPNYCSIHINEVNYLIEYNIVQERDILFWGQNYDKDNNLLPKTRYILIKDMTTNHILNVLNLYATNQLDIYPTYLKCFIREIYLRQKNQ